MTPETLTNAHLSKVRSEQQVEQQAAADPEEIKMRAKLRNFHALVVERVPSRSPSPQVSHHKR